MSRTNRRNAISRIRRGLSRERTLMALPFVVAALMLWNQAYLPLHLLVSHGDAHSHAGLEHAAHHADPNGYIRADGHSHGHSHSHGHAHAHGGHSHPHDDSGAEGTEQRDDKQSPGRHHDHSALDHLFAMALAVHPTVVALPPIERCNPSEVAYSAYACDGRVPPPVGRGPPAA